MLHRGLEQEFKFLKILFVDNTKTVVDRLKRPCLFLKPYDSEKFANTRVGEEFGIFKSLKIMVAAGKWWMFLSWSMTGTEKTHATR